MIINKKSFMGRYIQWLDKFYTTPENKDEDKLVDFKSLCPLFWMVLVFTISLPIGAILKYTILPIFRLIGKLFSKIPTKTMDIIMLKILPALIILIVVSCLALLIYTIGITSLFTIIGLIMSIFVVVFGLIIGISKISTDNSVAEFIYEGFKAIKDKACPLITWEDE